MMEIKIWYTMPEPSRERLCRWVRANNLDPSAIPMGSTIRIEGGNLTVEEVVRDNAGRVVLDPEQPNTVLRTTRTVPLLAPWPPEPA